MRVYYILCIIILWLLDSKNRCGKAFVCKGRRLIATVPGSIESESGDLDETFLNTCLKIYLDV